MRFHPYAELLLVYDGVQSMLRIFDTEKRFLSTSVVITFFWTSNSG